MSVSKSDTGSADFATLQLAITGRRNPTVLPRCLQILSRRGFILDELRSQPGDGHTVVMECRLSGPRRWHRAVVSLLERVVDVHKVEITGRATELTT